ncbi:MAG: aromatic ring-hydroxylating dioxygenase subunit alpha [Pseudomonadota bacterium]
MAFLRNTWYIAAWQNEVATGALFNRTILDETIVFYRKQDGAVAAIGDRCPHRFAPLHLGKIDGDCVQCPYHGLKFDSSGQCAHNPHGEGAIPKAARVKAYPVVERHLAVWIWMGDPALADPARIPDYAFLSAAKPSARNTGYLFTKANYELLCDNIMDLSHVDYLHPATLGGGALSSVKPQVTEQDGQVRIVWEARNTVAPPAFAMHLADPAAPADQCVEVHWSAPALMFLTTGVTAAGTSFEDGVSSANVHLMTPESETTTHYFFANTRSFLQDDADFNRMLDKILVGVFADEDKPMVEGQQKLMGGSDLWALKPVLLPGDVGAVRVRRVLERLIREESATAPSPIAAVN